MDFLTSIKMIAAAIGGWFGWLLGGADGFLIALIVLVVTDYVTGVMVAISDGSLSSSVGFRGIFKKVMIFALVAVGTVADKTIMPDAAIIRDAVVFFYIANESISITENAGKLGVPVPEKLIKALEQLKNKD